MTRYMKHLPTGILNVLNDAWMAASPGDYVETDAHGNELAPAIEGEVVEETPAPKRSRKKVEALVGDDALSADASRGL